MLDMYINIKNLIIKIGVSGYPDDGVREEELLDRVKSDVKNFVVSRKKRARKK